jgi:hypothetical protein
MKSALIIFASLVLTNFATHAQVQSYSPVMGKDCTLFVDLDAHFSQESGLRTFGGAGSAEELQDVVLIRSIIAERGYTLVSDKTKAEFTLEASNGIQCVMTDGEPGRVAGWVLDNFGTDIYLSGRFSGTETNGRAIENKFHRTIHGFRKKAKFVSEIKEILNFCHKS